MIPRRRSARRMLGVGLLLPGLLLTHPAGSPADPAPAKSHAKKSRPRASAPETPRAERAPRRAAAEPCVHTVRQGDSVSRIAASYGVRRQTIIDANHLARPDALHLGQRLTVPGCAGRRPPPPRRAVAATPAASADGTLVAVVGPRRVLTRLSFGVPELNGEAIDFIWPVVGPVASGFGRRRSGWHAGIDIRAEMGTPILAAAPGTVSFSGWERSYGRVVKIEHDAGFVTIYAHNLQNFAEVGDRVETGSVIATVGRSGRSTAYHLHFEIRQRGMAYNAAHLLPVKDTVVARADEATDPPEEDDEDE